ncbi:hypothetical protein Avbf_01371, partial [Armadillidium vulgare]
MLYIYFGSIISEENSTELFVADEIDGKKINEIEESNQQSEENLNELDNWENTFEEISNRDYEI